MCFLVARGNIHPSLSDGEDEGGEGSCSQDHTKNKDDNDLGFQCVWVLVVINVGKCLWLKGIQIVILAGGLCGGLP